MIDYEKGEFSSPNYPFDYGPNLKCERLPAIATGLIRASPGNVFLQAYKLIHQARASRQVILHGYVEVTTELPLVH